jgi:hypothetical protein
LEPQSLRITFLSAAFEALIKSLVVSGFTPFQADTKIVAKSQEVIVGKEAFNWFTDQINVHGVSEAIPKNN